MLKKMLLVLLFVLFVSVPCKACFTTWFLSAPTESLGSGSESDARFRVRFGLQMDEEAQVGETEVGVPEFGLQLDRSGDGDGDIGYGVYAITHLLSEEAAATWTGRPYTGFALDYGNSYGPVAGTRYGGIYVIEYQYQLHTGKLKADYGNAEHRFYVGICLRY